MNKIFNFALLLAGVLAFTACSDDEVGGEYTRENPVSVVKSALTFTADGGKGGVKFTAPAGAKAYTNTEWATAEIVGNDSVVVTVDVNAKLGGRGAKLTIKCGNDSTNVPITQTGSSFKIPGSKEFYLSDDPTVVSVPYTNEGPLADITTSSNEAISSTEITENTVNIAVTANETGSFRTSEVYLNNDGRVDTLRIIQGSEKDLLNKQYILGGIDLLTYSQTQNIQQSIFVELGSLIKSRGNLYYLTRGQIRGVTMQIPLKYNKDLSLTLHAGQAIGSVRQGTSTLRLITGVVDFNALNATFAYEEANSMDQGALSTLFLRDTLSLTAPLSVTPEGTIRGPFMDLGDNTWFVDSYGGYFGVTSFSGLLSIGALSGNSFAGWYAILASASLEEYDASGAKEAQIDAVKAKIAKKMAHLPLLGKPLFPVINR